MQRIAAESGFSISETIRHCRAVVAIETIQRGSYKSLTDVAALSGFGSVASMRRAIETLADDTLDNRDETPWSP
ncbi:transcriptional regulator GlxA family with amidase domain [Microbacterium resistens]|uniref:Transcriptional regulator GlxA family with amidase domain n=1 Tax=Microbacterium resistens TaxID=156977 RepID=A0ABU1SB84_9MICO|nr:transcriptional regulator GlxA family with amidase domain [Microbacterium resistens]